MEASSTAPRGARQDRQEDPVTVAQAYLELLASRGVDYLFCNAGTDFPSLVEAFARAEATGSTVPRPVVVPHENTAVSMAHGYHMVSGGLPAVMVHVGLGTANGINGLYNAARQNIPMLFTAGRTPIVESGLPGARNNFIHWAQEMFDQGGMVREIVKWDYELRHPAQLETVVDRAVALAGSEPRGPVYLTLPREVLAAPAQGPAVSEAPRLLPATAPQADIEALGVVAGWLREARSPLIVTSGLGRDPEAAAALAALAEDAAVPVVQYRPGYACLSHDHPMNAGWDAAPHLPDADLILVLDCDVPWLPAQAEPSPSCRIVHIGVDPHFSRYPIRGFRADLAVTGRTAPALRFLHERVGRLSGDEVQRRRDRAAEGRATRARAAERLRAEGRASAAITSAWASHCIDRVCGEDTILLNEYPLALDQITFRRPGSYFSHSPAGGLGWGLGAALGAKLAAPEKTVIVAVGDGAYMFGNPTPAHFVGRAMGLPFLTVIFNNRMWGAVHRATLSMYPDGHAARSDHPPLSVLEPSPDFEKIVEASGGYGERVTSPADLPEALGRALRAVREERRQAVLNVVTQPQFERTS